MYQWLYQHQRMKENKERQKNVHAENFVVPFFASTNTLQMIRFCSHMQSGEG
jgi:hypothetical protein